MTTRSTGLSSSASGWCTRYVSSGSSRAMRTTSAPWPRRPERPACCQNDATVPGKPANSTASSPAMSMTNSRAFVVASPRNSPSASARSQLAPVLGQVARPVGRHGVVQLRGDVLEPGPRAQCRQLRTTPRPDKRQRPRSLSNQIGHHPGGFGAPPNVAPAPRSRPADRCAVRAPHNATVRAPCGEPSSVTAVTV